MLEVGDVPVDFECEVTCCSKSEGVLNAANLCRFVENPIHEIQPVLRSVSSCRPPLISFYLCHDAADTLCAVLAEVHNTHGDREVYDFLPHASGGPVFKGAQDKRMYVSPFIAADAHYQLVVREDDEHLAITIRENACDELVLVVQLQVRRLPLTNRNLLRLLARDPLVPLKTSALIFWHAIRLWWRGFPWHRYRRNPDQADRPTTETTMYRRREVSPEADLPGSRPELPSGTVRPPYGGS